MREIVVWGQSGGGAFDVRLPVFAQLQGNFSWSCNPKIYRTAGGNVTAYTAGGRTRATGTLTLEVHKRGGLTAVMECVKYGVFAVGGAQFGGIRRVDGISAVNPGQNYRQFQLCYITGNVTTSVIAESLGWFTVSVPVEVCGVTENVPWVDIEDVRESSENATSISVFRTGDESQPLKILPLPEIEREPGFPEYGGTAIWETSRYFPAFSANSWEVEHEIFRYWFKMAYGEGFTYNQLISIYRNGELIVSPTADITLWTSTDLLLNNPVNTGEIRISWQVTANNGLLQRFTDHYFITVNKS